MHINSLNLPQFKPCVKIYLFNKKGMEQFQSIVPGLIKTNPESVEMTQKMALKSRP